MGSQKNQSLTVRSSRANQYQLRHQPRPRETMTAVTAAVLTALYAGHASAAGADADEPQSEGLSLQEVVVTATRRAVSAQDLPISITAVTGADLEQSGIEDTAQLARSMAGVNFTDKGPFSGINGSGLIIRGLNSEGTAGQLGLATPVVPPVATYVDETPLYFNIRLQDVDRVELLRGPQGTLYGSGSLGGTIRYVQNAPDPSGFDARAEVGVSDTQHTHAPNESVNGMLNIPLSDTLAVRMNVGWSYDAGFINQPNLYILNPDGSPASAQPGNVFSPPEKYAKDGTNSYEYHNARFSALWKPNELFSADLSYFYQLGVANGFPYAAVSDAAYNMPLSPLTQTAPASTNPSAVPQLYNAPVPPGVDRLSNADNSLEGAHDAVDLIAMTLTFDVGFATMSSATSWGQHLNHSTDDLTAVYTNFSFFQAIYGQDPRAFIIGRDELDDRALTQELRIASKGGGFLDYVAGLFYKNEYQNIQEHEFYPGYLDFFNGCSAINGPATPTQYTTDTASFCGVGETAYSPTSTNFVFGIPIIKDQTYIGDFETRFKDYAAFGELTAHLTGSWSVTGGVRVFKQTLTQAQQTGLLFDGGGIFLAIPPPPIANITLSDSFSRALFKVNTSYQFDKSNLIYATFSQGFRRGGVNALPPSEPGVGYTTPTTLDILRPDTADNYEVGVKGTVANRFRYSADVFDIQWSNVQEGVQLTPLVLPASLNVGNAFSRGFEMELEALLTQHFSTQLDYTYDQTKLTEVNALDINESVPPPRLGSALPGTPKNSLAASVVYQQDLGVGKFRWDVSAHYQSSLLPALSATVPTVGGYTMLETRLSYGWSHWLGTFYVTNLTNNLGISSYSDPAIYGNRSQAIVSQPRTFGLTFAYSFREK